MSDTLKVTLSSVPPNENVGNKFSWVDVDAPGNDNLFAQLVYVTNQNDPNSPTTTTNVLLSSILQSLDGVLLVG